jgi:copper chaperone
MHEFEIRNMSCGSCVRHIAKAVTDCDPAANVEVDLANRKVRIESSAEELRLRQVLEEAGYTAR